MAYSDSILLLDGVQRPQILQLSSHSVIVVRIAKESVGSLVEWSPANSTSQKKRKTVRVSGELEFTKFQLVAWDGDGDGMGMGCKSPGLKSTENGDREPRGILPYMSYIGMCRWEGYGFQAA